ncbi:hypothetical protein GGF46_001828 [Coemansia sp. RSA 552]|nr:hypothetical protein GGF46_001828 [Coemansia sp. RSA 552]
MDNMSGINQISSIGQEIGLVFQSIVMDITNFNGQAMEQINSIRSVLSSDLAAAGNVMQTNSFLNNMLLPLTNFPKFFSNAHDAVTDFESQLNTEIGDVNVQLNGFTSALGTDIYVAANDLGNLLGSLHTFVQNAGDIMISSPQLTATTLINHVIMLIMALLGTDPVKLVSDYNAWESKISSRESIVLANYNTLYTFVSTGLPQAESVVLGLLSGIAQFGNAVILARPVRQQQQQQQQEWLSSAYGGLWEMVEPGVAKYLDEDHGRSWSKSVSDSGIEADAMPAEYLPAAVFALQTNTEAEATDAELP